MKQPILVILLLTLSSSLSHGQLGAVSSSFKLARLKYGGGGDWYNDPSADVNLLKFVKEHTTIDVDPKYEFVEISSENFFSYPVVWLTGHGNIVFSDSEIRRLRTYLEKGGFLYVDDDYGLDRAFRREIEKVFPDDKLVELPFSHEIYHTHFSFPSGLPKIHRHEGRPPQGFGLFLDGRLAVFYTYECNLGDGWADPQVHNDPEDKRLAALRMGTNIIVWALTR
ncbi:MAG: DUF4159 domain-containing protein [Bacteroidota bacterium]